MVEKLKRLLGIAFPLHIALGFIAVAAFLVADDVAIGEGRFDAFITAVETFNFKWWLVALALVYWLLPVVLVITWRRARAAGVEIAVLQERVRHLLENQTIPVQVEIDEQIPVVFDEALRVPVAIDTKVDIDSDVEIEADIPIRATLPLDTRVQTSVFGLGALTVPIKADVPLDFTVPLNGVLRIRAKDIPISIDDVARIQLPPIEVPLRCTIETRIDLLSNLERAGFAKSEPPEPARLAASAEEEESP